MVLMLTMPPLNIGYRACVDRGELMAFAPEYLPEAGSDRVAPTRRWPCSAPFLCRSREPCRVVAKTTSPLAPPVLTPINLAIQFRNHGSQSAASRNQKKYGRRCHANETLRPGECGGEVTSGDLQPTRLHQRKCSHHAVQQIAPSGGNRTALQVILVFLGQLCEFAGILECLDGSANLRCQILFCWCEQGE